MYFRTKRVLFNILSSILAVLIVLVGFFAIMVVSLNMVYIKTNVEGYSMLPTLNSNVLSSIDSGDCVYINRFKDYDVNDIVVADVDWGGYQRYIIKRLIGKPGDKIQIKETEEYYELYVNDSLLYSKTKHDGNSKENIGSTNYYFNGIYKSFLINPEFAKYVNEDENGAKYIKLGENDYFLMGDNWGKTDDCLKFGPLKKANIVGKVDLVVPVNEEENSYILNMLYNMLFN